MNQCRNCGEYVPVEKAFCPNCSEPIEPEEKPNRAASFSSDMLATIRDDPEKFRDLLPKKAKRETEAAAPTAPAPETAPPAAAAAAATPPPAAPPPVRSDRPAERAPQPAPPAKSNTLYLLIGIGAVVVLILILVIFFASR